MDQVHIRDAQAVALLRQLSKQTGKPMKDIVREALNRYALEERTNTTPEQRIAHSRALLERDHAALKPADEQVALDDLYDAQGLPI